MCVGHPSPLRLRSVGAVSPFTFRWPDEVEIYETCHTYEVVGGLDGKPAGEVAIAYGWRTAFGARRRRILVFRRHVAVLVELVGTDAWDQTREVAWHVLQPGSRRHVQHPDDLPADFMCFEVARAVPLLSGPFARRGLAVRIREDNHADLVRLALIRERHKKASAAAPTGNDSRPCGRLREVPRASTEGHPAMLPEARLGVAEGRQVVSRVAEYAVQYRAIHLMPAVEEFTGVMARSNNEALSALRSPAHSLSMLLGYYAFARQGGERAGYNEVCTELLQPYLSAAPLRLWNDFADWRTLYAAFESGCARRGIRPNSRFNEGLLRDIYELARQTPNTGLFQTWADAVVERHDLAGVHAQLDGIHGVGPKIAAFVSRDVVCLADAEATLPPGSGRYVQPVDVWIGRIAAFLNPHLTVGASDWTSAADSLDHACRESCVSGIAFNQGGWYLGSKVAKSAERLITILAGFAAPSTDPADGQRP